jgi:uncharacterized protein YerC
VTGPTVTRPAHFHRQARGRKRLRDKAEEPVVVGGTRIPREVQLLALAITFEDMIRTGEALDYADIARRTGVSRARICQITRLLELPPEIQEQLLSDQTGQGGRTS